MTVWRLLELKVQPEWGVTQNLYGNKRLVSIQILGHPPLPGTNDSLNGRDSLSPWLGI